MGITGEDKYLEVTTIDDNKVKIKTSVVNDLEILPLDRSMCHSLSNVYAKEKWPFDKNDSPSPEDIKNIKAFDSIPLQFINRKIGLLVGMNEPEIIKPIEVIQAENSKLYASHHKIGWAINRPLKSVESQNHCCRTRVNRIEDIEAKFDKVFSADFEETNQGDDIAGQYSPDEKKWIKFVDDNCKKSLETNKLEISLPFKQKIDMPKNRDQAFSRVISTRKKLLNDETLLQEYSDFMKMIRENDFVEVPNEELNPDHQRVWFLTHHAVRHKTKERTK